MYSIRCRCISNIADWWSVGRRTRNHDSFSTSVSSSPPGLACWLAYPFYPFYPSFPSFPVPLRVRVPFRFLLVSFASAAPRFAQFLQTGSCRSTYHPLSSLCATLSALLWFSSTTEQIPIDLRLLSRYRVKLVGSNDYRLAFSFSLSSRRILRASCLMLGCSEILCLKYVQYRLKI